jgi:iron-sulfur cluster assembly protein
MVSNPVSFSETAINEIKKIQSTKGLDDSFGLRIGVKGSGCSGTTFILGFDQKNENDEQFMIEEIRIYIEKKHFLYLVGIGIDFVDNNSQRGFTFVSK